MSGQLAKLRALAAAAGLVVKDCGHGHIQVRGALLVNWWPESKRRTAHVAQTNKGKEFATAEDVIRMAQEIPAIKPLSDRDKRSQRRAQTFKRRLLMRDPRCRWCLTPLTIETATIDHIVPLMRGGLDNRNNMCLACEKCNKSRGHDMPEITTTRAS